jgi:pyruvate kinase
MVELYHGNSCSPDETGAFAVPSDRFFAGISAGDLVTVGDGSAVLCIDSVDAQNARARARIRVGGVINQRRGLTVQGGDFRPSCLTEKDLADLEFIAGANVFDAVALSFVADAANVERARRLLAGSDRDILLVAKIETEAGLENLEAICRAADVIMAARGDLALAMPWVELPAAVLAIQEAARYARKPWILGTQVAEGLERFAIPTRAEICDLANWMRTGCDGVLLSYETAFGARPIEAVRTVRTVMDRWSA